MRASSDSQLLLEFAERRSEAAFAELVRRHLDFVHSAAFRMVNDPHLAKDVSQGVFVALAKDAGKLAGHPVLCGWLHRTTRNIAAKAVRTEVRRRHREQEAAAMHAHPESNAVWEEIAPHLDAALAGLAAADRDAVLLRYFENRSAGEMASILGVSVEAAQKRVNRAVEKLRMRLAGRGVTAGAAGLAGTLSAQAVQPAPAALAAAVCSRALTAPVSAGTAISGTAATLMSQKALAITAASAVLILTGFAVHSVLREARNPSRTSAATPQLSTRAVAPSRPDRPTRSRAEQASIDRKKELARLKVLWLQTKNSNGPSDTPQRRDLSKESARLLMCSEEMLELLAFLEEHKLYNTVEFQIEDLFEGMHAREARELLINLPETTTIVGERSWNGKGEAIRDEWSRAAGRNCPDEEFEAFRAALNCPHCAIEALYGRNERRMQTDPNEAFASSLDALLSGIPSISGRYGITRLFESDVPEEFDWAAAEARLPVDGSPEAEGIPSGDDSLFGEIREWLFWGWARTDPAAVANHVMAHPDRFDAGLMEKIVGGYYDTNPQGIAAWVATFPEGPYFDVAAKSAATYASISPVEIQELIHRIGDPEIREEALERFMRSITPRRAR